MTTVAQRETILRTRLGTARSVPGAELMVLEGMGQSGLREIEKIRAALARIEDGSYGTCVRCGADISAERLDILPATPFCRSCAI